MRKIAYRPWWLFGIVVVTAFAAEWLVMSAIHLFEVELSQMVDAWAVHILDATLLALLISPVLYYAEIVPMARHVREVLDNNKYVAVASHILEHGSEAVGVFSDNEGACHKANRAMVTGFGISENGEKKLDEIFQDPAEGANLFAKLRANGELHGSYSLINTLGESVPAMVSMTLMPSMDGNGNGNGNNIVVTINDLSEVIQAKENLEFVTRRDPVTTLQNALSFEDAVVAMLKADNDSQKRLCLVGAVRLMDMKMIGDVHGNEVVDLMLCSIATELSEYLDDSKVARLSQNEFGIILCDAFDLDEVRYHLNKIRAIVAQRKRYLDAEVGPEVKVGYCLIESGAEPRDIISNALVAAHHDGDQSTIEYSDVMQEELRQKAAFEKKLRAAVEVMAFDLVYQPQVSIDGSTLVGVEVLLRWFPEDGEPVSPEKFIPELERNGLIYDVGMWVLEQACMAGTKWVEEGFPSFKVAVNVSAKQLSNEDFASDVYRVLANTHFPPSLLELEFTESCIVADPEAVEIIMKDLAALGVHIAIDDFGTGYSSLSYLRRFKNIGKLKIDRSFVDSILADGDSVITDAIIGLAKSLNMLAIAEGVESSEQIGYLKEHGCDELQGYFFSKPLSEGDLRRFVLASMPGNVCEVVNVKG